MYRRLILFLLLYSASLAMLGQEFEYVQITSTDQLEEDVDYIITHKETVGYSNLVMELDSRSDVFYDFKGEKRYAEMDNIYKNSQHFRVKKSGGAYYLYILERDTYVSCVTNKMTTNSGFYALYALTEAPTDPLKIEKKSDRVELYVGNKFIMYHKTLKRYRLRSSISSDFEPVLLYKVQEKTGEPELEIGPESDLTNTNFKGTIKLNRRFYSTYLNTIVLPFTIENPWEVFGEGAIIYEPMDGTDSEITFKKLKKGDKMVGYSPYLIGGTLSGEPYTITGVTLNYKTIGTRLKTTVGQQVIHSVFQKADMGKTGNYVLFKDKFRSCASVQALQIEPYKWYIVAPSGKKSTVKWGKTIYIRAK